MDLAGKLNQANGRLKAGKVGVSILQRGDRFYLRATLPPRPGSIKTIPHRQEISLGFRANPLGLQLAEKEAKRIGALNACKDFSWEPYLKQVPQLASNVTIGDWVERFAADYKNSIAGITWTTDYEKVFQQLPAEEPLTEKILRNAIARTKPNSRTRRRFCLTLGKLARFANLECDFKPLQGNYSAKRVTPRDLPDDQTIAEWFFRIENSGWRWVYGMIATFGLRSHETFFLDTNDLEQGRYYVTVLRGKTGRRLVWACFPEWVEQFELRTKSLPAITGSEHSDFTEKTGKYFRNLELPFGALDMRHRWAIRALEFGLDISLAAQQMGHSVEVHSETYHHWISSDVHQRAFDALMRRPGRPQAPTLTEK